ncbi:hypothetical protein GGX14DRAFT_608703 [Mycena pura]|uniref:DUF6699 domain-containing protein n=1 Tax=Mycena pura TaxID=153505 RepID=A0AAD6YER8_9AGAR|nr:hypothetical protein GGX14DRAFT_608703 [Mycena pura]
MAAPFVYVPEAASPSAPDNPFYSIPANAHSPFIPPSVVLHPSSPFLEASSPPGTPEFFANSVPWPTNAPAYDSPYTASWAPLQSRQRTTSWHGPNQAATGSPFLQPTALPAFLHSQSAYLVPGHRRSSSWGAANAPPRPVWSNAPDPWASPPAPAPAPAQQIHPWLNGDAPSPVFHFDLSRAQFAPLRLVSPNPPQSAMLDAAQLREPAFHPPRTALRILHPRLPFWPIDLALPADAAPVPLVLADVLVALHRALHQRITRADWASLGAEDQEAVTHAFTHRCRAEAVRSGVPPAHLREREIAERNEGVKRVDFLCGKTTFRGLVRSPEDPDGVVRLLTA